jgi:pimeloyl-[acyl-carrier protein] methyl ester esterase
MTTREQLEMLLLHALPLDGSMWAGQMELVPGSTYAPSLYSFGESIEEWAVEALKAVKGNRVVVVGCSVGGSCAIEVAVAAPDRVAALVLIGTKAAHRPDPALHAAALDLLKEKGLEAAWDVYWAPLFSISTDCQTINAAKRIALRQSPLDIARGVSCFTADRAATASLQGFANQSCSLPVRTIALQARK